MIQRGKWALAPQETEEDALHASETRYRRLFETAQDGILILDAASGQIADANPYMMNILGYSHSDFVGKELWQIGLFEDVTASKAAFRELQENGYIRYDDLPLRTASGGHIDVEFVSNIYLVDDEQVIQCNIRDITQRKRAEQALRESERLNRNLVEHLPHSICVKGRNSNILFCNANYARDLGVPADEVIGKNAFAFYSSARAEAYHADDHAVMASGETKDMEAREDTESAGHPDGEEHWVHTVKVPYRSGKGEIVGVLEVREDITERKRLESQLRQSQKLDAIGHLAGGVAHDFNNLLTVIMVHCDLISSELRENDPLKGDIEQIRRCGARATNLTRQLLAFSRKQVLEVRVLDLNVLVSGLDSLLQRLIGEDIDLQTSLAPDLSRINADPGQIEQVIMNLILNARDAMPTGGKLTIRTANVSIGDPSAESQSLRQVEPCVMLSVSDSGSGMDSATAMRVFEPFFTTKDQGKGTGLGLSTVYGIVKQSGGSIWCDSEEGVGTTFTMYLPRVEERAELVMTEVVAPAARGTETVLVAEDDEMVRELVVQMLAHDGYRVISAKNGAEALREFEKLGESIDLVVTDVVMPVMSGTELVRRVEAIRPGIRVMFMSGYTGDAVLSHGVIEGGAAFLQKPFTRDALNRKVRAALDA